MRHAESDARAMRQALELARQSLLTGDEDVPVGALVLGPDGAVLAGSANRREALTDPTAHASHRPEVVGGVLAEECGSIVKDFFARRR
jgi:tRNA(Arg) A34 adenosine deaminase TadA